MNKPLSLLHGLVGGSLAAMLGLVEGVAWAEEAGAPARSANAGQLEEVVVTARRRVERLQDFAGSAAAVDEGLLRDIGGVTDLRRLLDQVVGVTIVETQTGDLAEPSIRGAGQARNRTSVSATGVYRNGAYFVSTSLGGRSFERFDTYDLERAEVLRGIQGALYGRNALGGAINMISVKPQKELDFEFGALAGENDRLGLDMIANIPVTETLSFRGSYAYERQDDGFVKDANGDAVDTIDYDHLRLSLRYQPIERLDLTYMIDWQDEEYMPGVQVRRTGTVLNLNDGDPWQTTINSEHRVFSEVINHNLNVDYEVDLGTLTSVTNFRQRDLEREFDSDYSGPSPAAATRNLRALTEVDADVFFQDVRFASIPINRVSFLVGADYYAVDTSEYIDNFALGGQTIPTSSIRSVNIDQTSWAVYGSVDYDFANLPLRLTAEARYASDDVSGDVLTVLPNQGNLVTTDVDDDRTYENMPWGVMASWRFGEGGLKALDESMLYGKVGTSYRHGGLNLNEGLPTDRYETVPLYGEETSMTYEVGFKSTWLGNRLRFNGAVFTLEYEDFLDNATNGCPLECTYFDPDTLDPLGFDANGEPIVFDADGNEGIPSPQAVFVTNIGEVEAWGVELELAWRLAVEATGGFLDMNLGWARQLGEVASVRDDVAEELQGRDGARLNRLRERQIKGNLRYRQPLRFLDDLGLRGAELLVSATYNHEHGGFRNLNENPWGLDGVDRLDLVIGLDTQNWTLRINGRNVLDHEYELWGNPLQYRLNEPRYVYGEFRYRL